MRPLYHGGRQRGRTAYYSFLSLWRFFFPLPHLNAGPIAGGDRLALPFLFLLLLHVSQWWSCLLLGETLTLRFAAKPIAGA